jgi:hypothetical protein
VARNLRLRRPVYVAIVALFALVVCSACGSVAEESASTASTGLRTITIAVENGAPVGGIQRPTVERGEQVALDVRSDIADDVHLHGYDLSEEVKPGSRARIVFVADLPGRFVVELESRHLQIAQLEVRP